MSNCPNSLNSLHGFATIFTTGLSGDLRINRYLTCISCGERRALRNNGELVFWNPGNLTWGSDMADERPEPTDGSANPPKYPNGRNEPCEICGDGGHTEPACPNPSKSETKERKI